MKAVLSKRGDRGYEKAAQTDPYFAVIPFPQFRRSGLSEERLKEFFSIGDQHIESVLSGIRTHFDLNFKPRRVLDYGCGTGRLVVPLAKVADQVVGADISPTMLEETRRNCQRFNLNNVELVLADDNCTQISGNFDLIHSTIVFQHIPPKRVAKIVRGLLGRLEPGGFGALQFMFWSPTAMRASRFIKGAIPFGNSIANLIKGRPRDFGYIGLHPFSMNKIVAILCDAGVREIFATFDDGKAFGGDRSVDVTFRAGR